MRSERSPRLSKLTATGDASDGFHPFLARAVLAAVSEAGAACANMRRSIISTYIPAYHTPKDSARARTLLKVARDVNAFKAILVLHGARDEATRAVGLVQGAETRLRETSRRLRRRLGAVGTGSGGGGGGKGLVRWRGGQRVLRLGMVLNVRVVEAVEHRLATRVLQCVRLLGAARLDGEGGNARNDESAREHTEERGTHRGARRGARGRERATIQVRRGRERGETGERKEEKERRQVNGRLASLAQLDGAALATCAWKWCTNVTYVKGLHSTRICAETETSRDQTILHASLHRPRLRFEDEVIAGACTSVAELAVRLDNIADINAPNFRRNKEGDQGGEERERRDPLELGRLDQLCEAGSVREGRSWTRRRGVVT